MLIPRQMELTSIFLILVGLIEQKRGKAKGTVLFKKTENETRTLLFADERNWKQKKPVPIVRDSIKKTYPSCLQRQTCKQPLRGFSAGADCDFLI